MRRRRVGPRTDAGEVEARLAGLEALTIRDLRREWQNIYQAAPPSRLSRDLLTCAIAYDIQQRAHGDLRPATQRRLRTVAETPAGKAEPGFAPAIALKPGARLVREWHGRVHTVAVLDHGFDYEGEIHRSLTQIARRITGAHWSGRVFFGLRTRARQVRSTMEQADE